MSNPFDDLKAADESDSDSSEDDAADEPAAEPGEPEPSTAVDETPTASADPATDAESEQQTDSTPSDSEPSDEQPSPAETGPAFAYSEVRQKPLYARDDTWNDLEDELGITVTPELRRMGIRDEETREIHDAILKVAIDHADEIPETLAEQRRRSQ